MEAQLQGRATTQASRRAPRGAPERRSAAPGVPRSAEKGGTSIRPRRNDYHCIVSSEARITTGFLWRQMPTERSGHGTRLVTVETRHSRLMRCQRCLLGREGTCHAGAGSTDVPTFFISDVDVA